MLLQLLHIKIRGPRAGLIFFKKELEEQINEVYFRVQGGPHPNAIGGVASQLLEAQSEEFVNYIKQVKNAQALSDELINLGYKISTNGTKIILFYVILKTKV